MSDSLEHIAGRIEKHTEPGRPPVHLWNPALSGNIDILIRADGRWLHDGQLIRRDALVRLFAGILRREPNGHYYLLTPVEKWRIRVEFLPLIVVDHNCVVAAGGEQLLEVRTNTGWYYKVDEEHPLFLPEVPDTHPGLAGVPAVALDNGLSALFSRPAWYRLAELCEEDGRGMYLRSGGQRYALA